MIAIVTDSTSDLPPDVAQQHQIEILPIYVHIGDSNRLAPGQGHLDFSTMVSTLREIGYHGYLSAELLPQPDPDAAAALTIRHMRTWLPARE